MSTTNTKPLEVIRDGSLKATIWRNAGEKGDFYSVRITRTWTDEQGNFHDSDSFSGTELLRVARLAGLAYDLIVIQRRNDRVDETA